MIKGLLRLFGIIPKKELQNTREAPLLIGDIAINLLKCVQNNPDRFMCNTSVDKDNHHKSRVRLYDKQEKILMSGTKLNSVHGNIFSDDSNTFTSKELQYLYYGVYVVYRDLKEKESKYKGKLISIYC